MSPLAPISSHHDYDPPPEYLRQGPDPVPLAGERRAWGRVLAVAVALVTLSAFAGGVWFAYQEGVRQGLEQSPPLVRADASPTKIVPADPGGLVVANQDKRVFETIAAAAPPPRVEQLLPPPEQPMPPPAPEPRVAAAPPPAVMPPAATPPRAASPPAAMGFTPVPAPIPEPTPAAAAAPLVRAPNGVPVPPREALAESPPPGAPLALLPPARPVTPPAAVPAQPPARAPAAVAQAAPPGATAGIRVQLGAFGDSKVAMDAWETLKKKHGDALAQLQPTVVPATVQGRQFQRLQAGPLPSSAAANELCTKLKAAGTDCLVVRP